MRRRTFLKTPSLLVGTAPAVNLRALIATLPPSGGVLRLVPGVAYVLPRVQ